MKTRGFFPAVVFATMAFTFILCSCGGPKRIASTEIAAVCSQLGTVKDKDGNTYKTAKIGEDEWIVENLKTIAQTGNSKCYDDVEENCEKYGRLYDLKAANEICPDGWELPVWGDYKKLGQMYGEIRKFPWTLSLSDTLNDERAYIGTAYRKCNEEADNMDYRAKVNERGTQLTRADVIQRCETAKALAIRGMENRRNPEEQLRQIEQQKQMNAAEKEVLKERDRCGFFELKGGICEEGGVCLFKDLEGYYYIRKSTALSNDENAVKLTRDNKFDDVYPVAGIKGEINGKDLRSVRCIRKK
jgi:uncharacterized protein (TIGR02145 family)